MKNNDLARSLIQGLLSGVRKKNVSGLMAPPADSEESTSGETELSDDDLASLSSGDIDDGAGTMESPEDGSMGGPSQDDTDKQKLKKAFYK